MVTTKILDSQSYCIQTIQGPSQYAPTNSGCKGLYKKVDIFITFTCNSKLAEISNEHFEHKIARITMF